MSRLHKCVNLIPVIAKADTMAGEEIADFKTRVRSPHVSFVGKRAEILIGSHRYPLLPYADLPGPHIRERGWGVPGRSRGDYHQDSLCCCSLGQVVTTSDGRQVHGRDYPWGG